MKIIFKIIKGIVTFFLIIVLFLVLLQKVTDNKMAIGNIYIFEVASESMVPDYLIGDVIVVKKADGANLEVGDDVTYLGSESNLSGLTITHRIIRKRTENNVNYYVTKGIANSIEDPEISEEFTNAIKELKKINEKIDEQERKSQFEESHFNRKIDLVMRKLLKDGWKENILAKY